MEKKFKKDDKVKIPLKKSRGTALSNSTVQAIIKGNKLGYCVIYEIYRRGGCCVTLDPTKSNSSVGYEFELTDLEPYLDGSSYKIW